MYFNNPLMFLEVPGSSPLTLRCAYNHASFNWVQPFCFRIDYHNQNVHVNIFQCNAFLMYKRGATFIMIPRWRHVKNGSITLMFELVVVAGIPSRDQEQCLAAEQQVNKDVLHPKLTQSQNQDNTKRLYRTLAQNYWLNSESQEHSYKTVAQNHHQNWELLVPIVALFSCHFVFNVSFLNWFVLVTDVIHLIKWTWFLLGRKDGQIEVSLAN